VLTDIVLDEEKYLTLKHISKST